MQTVSSHVHACISYLCLFLLLQSNPRLKQLVREARTYDQVFAQNGYQVETFGKYHLPNRWQRTIDGDDRAIKYDSYSLNFESPTFTGASKNTDAYVQQVDAWADNTTLSKNPGSEQETNSRSKWPYIPLSLDASNNPRNPQLGEPGTIGIDSLPANFSQTRYTGSQGIFAIQRLAQRSDPWAITVSFENPRKSYERTTSDRCTISHVSTSLCVSTNCLVICTFRSSFCRREEVCFEILDESN